MKTFSILMTTVLGSAAAVAALPTVSNMEVSSVGPGSRTVTVSYDLDVTAVVTFDVKTNGVSIGTAAGDVGGEADKIVLAGTGRKAYWTPHHLWPGFSPSDIEVELKAWSLDAPPTYMVVDAHNGVTRYYADAETIPYGGVTNKMYKDTHLVMRKIPAANVIWTMGSTAANASSAKREIMHRVKLSSDYYMAIYEFTQGQFMSVTNAANPSSTWTSTPRINPRHRPLDKYSLVSMRGDVKCNAANPTPTSLLGVLRSRSGLAFDLPNAAQWEFACRGGLPGNITVAGAKSVDEIAWHSGNWKNDPAMAERVAAGLAVAPHEVGILPCNAFGLYDMQGNAFEFSVDFIGTDTEAGTIATFGDSIGTDTDGQKIYSDPPVQTGSQSTTTCMLSQKYSDGSGSNLLSPGRHAAGRTATTAEAGVGFRLICPVVHAGRIVAP